MCCVVNGKVEEPAVDREFRMVNFSLIVTWETLFSFRFELLLGAL